jgi:hypothetical protein
MAPRWQNLPAVYGTATFSGWGITRVRWDAGHTTETETADLCFVSRPTKED